MKETFFDNEFDTDEDDEDDEDIRQLETNTDTVSRELRDQGMIGNAGAPGEEPPCAPSQE